MTEAKTESDWCEFHEWSYSSDDELDDDRMDYIDNKIFFRLHIMQILLVLTILY